LSVGDKLTITDKVSRGTTGQGPVDERYLEHRALPDRQTVQLTKHWRNMVGSLSGLYQLPGGSVLYGLQATEQFVRDVKKTKHYNSPGDRQ